MPTNKQSEADSKTKLLIHQERLVHIPMNHLERIKDISHFVKSA